MSNRRSGGRSYVRREAVPAVVDFTNQAHQVGFHVEKEIAVMPTKVEEQESKTTTHPGKEAVSESGTTDRSHSRKRGGEAARRGAADTGAEVGSRHPQFMVITHGIAGGPSLGGPEFLEQSLRNSPEIEVLDVLTPRNVFALFGDGLPGSQRVIVARMDEQKAAFLARQAGMQFTIERDHLLTYGQSPGPLLFLAPGSLPQSLGFTAKFRVVGSNNDPVEGAQVGLLGSASLVQGVTDQQGELELEVTGEAPAGIRTLFVRPQADFWTVWIPEPEIHTAGENVISLTPLSATFQGFPRQQLVGWGHKAMKIDQLPPSYKGKGIKIGIIDSGVTASHSVLRGRIKSGYDAILRTQDGWDQDAIGRGTHSAGIICGRSPSGGGMQGVAPEAEAIVCKTAPGGLYSSLLEAIDFCITQQVDLIHISLGGLEPSQVVEQKLVQAKQLGVACIVAAGDSGGMVQYPASSPNVLAVAALGKHGEFPLQSSHAQTVTGFSSSSGFFSPAFSCFGPQIAVCGPGVAVVSSVPPDNYAAWDGTAAAAAYVTGLAALVLAHHPDFQAQGAFSIRSAYRVERLFQILKQSSQAINVGDPLRVGVGLPDAVWATQSIPASPEFAGLPHSGIPFAATGNPSFSLGPTPFSGPMPLRQQGNPNPALWPAAQYGPITGNQGSMASLVMAIQQIRAMMQSAGLL